MIYFMAKWLLQTFSVRLAICLLCLVWKDRMNVQTVGGLYGYDPTLDADYQIAGILIYSSEKLKITKCQ